MLLYGPVRVAQDARPGKAKMVVELAATSTWKSFPTELPVEIR